MKNTMILVLCALLALFPFLTAAAEDTVSLDELQPLIDTTTAAALNAEDQPITFTENDTLPASFIREFFTQGQSRLTDIEAQKTALQQKTYLESCFSVDFNLSALPVKAGEVSSRYTGLVVMSAELTEDSTLLTVTGSVYTAGAPLAELSDEGFASIVWQDRRCTLTFRKDDTSPIGWKITSFSVNENPLATAMPASTDEPDMAEYMGHGFIIRFPAEFADILTENADGISAAAGTSAFSVSKKANTDGWTAQSIIDARQSADPDAECRLIETSGAACVITRGTVITVDIYLASEAFVYQVQLQYSAADRDEYDPLIDTMINTFGVDEISVG